MSEISGQKVGYARVSTVDQSLDVQVDQLQAAGAGRIFKEKVSGSTAKRQELENLLDYIRDGDQVIVAKLDRLARSTKDLLEIKDRIEGKGATLRVININLDTSTPNGKLMLTMLGAIAQFERELLLERQAEGIQRAKAAGKYKGRQPTAKAKAAEVLELAAAGATRQAIADQVGVGVASVYRILREHKG